MLHHDVKILSPSRHAEELFDFDVQPSQEEFN
jgi:hypothetical protein